MILKRILQTYSFRFTLLYVVAISLMASLISLLVYLSITVDYFAEVRRATHAELEIAVDAFRKGGEEGFQEHVSKRSLLDMGDRYYFVLARAGSDKVLAGNLEDWPLLDDTKSGWDAFGRTLSGRPMCTGAPWTAGTRAVTCTARIALAGDIGRIDTTSGP